MKIYGILIAAGFSGRMKRFKPLLDFKGKPFVITIAEKLASVCDKVVVVTGHKSDAIEEVIKSKVGDNLKRKILIVFNPDFASGMFTSLQKGAEYCSDADWVIYHFVDQPNLPLQFYADFIEQTDFAYDWIQPSYGNKKGHPVLLGKSAVKLILGADKLGNLRQLSHSGKLKRKTVDLNYLPILSDVDTPNEYEKIIENG